MKIAIMQPCYLPWRGYFALMNLCDAFVHLDDVPLPQGRSYQTRTAIKTSRGLSWLSLPVYRQSGQLICDSLLVDDDSWRRKHLATLRNELPDAACLVADLYERNWTHLAEVNIALTARLAEALDLHPPTHLSSELRGTGEGSNRILDLCRRLNATCYITGHGAKNYLQHEQFEEAGIEVMYLNYDLSPYPQPHGPFDPFVTVLDVLAHAEHPADCIEAELVRWREFLSADANLAPSGASSG